MRSLKFSAVLISFSILLAFLSPTCVPIAMATSENWWSSNFQYRMKITLNNAAISENLVNFPLPIVLGSSQTSFWSHVNRTTGSDVRFVDANNASELYFETEKFDTTNNASIWWVKVPQIDSASSTDFIWLYYGNNTTTFDSYYDSTNVWDTNYIAVYHMNETTGTLYDATINSNDGTSVGVQQDAAGLLDGADDFESTEADRYDIASSDSLNITGTLTVETWLKYESVTSAGIVAKGLLTPTNTPQAYSFATGSSGAKLRMRFGTTNYDSGAHGFTAGSFSYGAGVYSDTANTITYYANGSQLGSAVSCTASITSNAAPVHIGAYESGGNDNMDGIFDEIRISNIVRSANWIAASYQYEVDQSKFTFGSEDTYAQAYTASLSQAMSATWTTSIGWVANVALSQSLTSVWSTLPHWIATIGLSQTIGSSWNVLAELSSLPAYFFTGLLYSINLFNGIFASSINQFNCTVSSLPDQTTLEVLFSQDNSTWYNSTGGSSWQSLSAGSNVIDLSSLMWSGSNFYYKASFNSTGIDTPVLDDIAVGYKVSGWNAAIQWGSLLSLVQGIGFGWSAITNWAAHITLIQSFGVAWSVLARWTANIGLSQSIGSAWNVLIQHGFLLGLSQGILTGWNLLGRWTANIGLSQSFSPVWSMATLLGSHVGLTQSITSTYSLVAGWSLQASLTQTINNAWSILTRWSGPVNLSQNIVSSWTGALHWIAHIGLSQSISSIWSILTRWSGNINLSQSVSSLWSVASGLFFNVGLSQSITATWANLVRHSFLISLSQGISTVWAMLNHWTANVNLSQSLSAIWYVTAGLFHQGEWAVDLSQSISASWSILAQWTANVGLSYSFVSVWSSATRWMATVGFSQAIGTSWSSLTNWVAHVSLSQSVNTSWNVLARWGGSVGLSQSVNAVWTFLETWNIHLNLSQGIIANWNLLSHTAYHIGLAMPSTITWSVNALLVALHHFTANLDVGVLMIWTASLGWMTSGGVSNLWKILALFSIAMLAIAVPYGFIRRRKPDEEEELATS